MILSRRGGILMLGWLLLFNTLSFTASGSILKARQKRLKQDAKLKQLYTQLRDKGTDTVGHSIESAKMRDYLLSKKKRKGLLRKRKATLADVLFPGVAPEVYEKGERMFIITDHVQSKKTNVPYGFYDLPGCPLPQLANFRRKRSRHARKNLGARLQGLDLTPAPYALKVMEPLSCTMTCNTIELVAHEVRWLRKLVERQYRIHFVLDSLPVLMRSLENNWAVRGFPVGFKAPPSYTGLEYDEYYLYNHLKFTISVKRQESGGYHITGFDVHPVSIKHAEDGSTCVSDDDEDVLDVLNDPNTYLDLRTTSAGDALPVTYSYEVEWEESELNWSDRWDVYLIGHPDDDIHLFAIMNSLMIVLFLTGVIAVIMIRTLHKDISAYNEMSAFDDGTEETGWKLVHGDVFRPPTAYPAALAVFVGTGAQIGTAFFLTLVCAMVHWINPVKKGQTLTAVLMLYVLSGSVSGYVSARIAKFSNCRSWKFNTLATATALPGLLVGIFSVLNVFLSWAGAATAVSFWMLLAIFALWVCVSSPLVFVGAFVGYQTQVIETPVKTNQIARFVPDQPWYNSPPISFLVGGILPFGSVCIELFFIMSALWLYQIYYIMGFLVVVLLILAATCAQVSVVMDYLQLCTEDHRWWWKSFGNCASAGLYLFLYALWFLSSRMQLVGLLSVVVYLTYMFMISLCFGLFCGSVGFLCAFWFNKKIYGALKVD